MIVTDDGEPIFNATIEVFQIVNDRQQYIDHDVTSSKSRAFTVIVPKPSLLRCRR